MEIIYGLIGAIFVLTILMWYLNKPSVKGRIGEHMVKKTLTKTVKKDQGLIYKDIMFGTDDKSVQIDNILITQKCVYVIEVKNYKGRIYGSENDNKWCQTIKYRNKKKGKNNSTYYKTHIEKNDFYNPIMQNQTHIRRMIETLPSIQNMTIMNIVVFLNAADLKNLTINSRGVVVINLRKLKHVISEIEERTEKAINEQMLLVLKEEILLADTKSKENMKQHVARIQSKYKG